MKFNDFKESDLLGLRERFLQIISEHPQKWWSEKLEVSQGLVSSNWKSGKLPRIETLYKILCIKEISPNWFFFNIEPKYLKDIEGAVKDPNIVKNRETQLKVLETESELFELRDKVKHLETCIKMQELSVLVKFLNDEGEIAYDKDVFSSYILPLLTLMRMLNDLLFKSFEIVAKNQIDENTFKGIINWINSNFESSQFTTIAALKSLDKKFP